MSRQRVVAPLLARRPTRAWRAGTIVSRWRLRTIRGRLLVGFSATLCALVASGLLSIYAIQQLYGDMHSTVSSTNRLSSASCHARLYPTCRLPADR